MADGRDDRRRRRRLVLLGGAVLLIGVFLVGWHKVASSPRLCASCHAMRSSTSTAAASVHSGVSCLACHTGAGLAGSLRFLTSLPRETLAQVTGWKVAGGVMKPVACSRCHRSTNHPARAVGGAPCTSCHGDAAHPGPSPTTSAPHPSRYDQTHGRDAAANPGSCASCHQSRFCVACHFRTTFPHSGDWIALHGRVEEAQGPRACSLCHPTTFCAGCHGTDIPHRPNWLGEHYRALRDSSDAPCYVCHPRTDCSTCHAKHGIHREQDLYR